MEIVLIRHGKPTSATNPKVNAIEYTKWIRQYNLSDVSVNSRPEKINTRYKHFYSIASDLPRAIHSAIIYQDRPPCAIDSLYREMDIPRYKLPFHLRAWHWLILCRILWMLGVKGPFESFKQAKLRADIAANQLIQCALEKNALVVFGHGYMNRYIRKSLIKKGWSLQCKSNDYWGVTHLQKTT